MNKRNLKEYRIWKAMKARCYAPSLANSNRQYYQQDGIHVCDRWRNSYENFIADMGPIPGDDYSIERIDIYGDYCPENCKWIPMSSQQKNRRNSRLFTIGNKTMCLKDWAREYDISYTALHKRIAYRGHSFEESINSLMRLKEKNK